MAEKKIAQVPEVDAREAKPLPEDEGFADYLMQRFADGE